MFACVESRFNSAAAAEDYGELFHETVFFFPCRSWWTILCLFPRFFFWRSSQIAQQYYGTDKLYVFNGLHNNPEGGTFEERDADRPIISNLYDTFVAVSLATCFAGFAASQLPGDVLALSAGMPAVVDGAE